ncbi:MAG: flagellar hook-basal body complex protein FliE [Flavobacteriaceae bacterium]
MSINALQAARAYQMAGQGANPVAAEKTSANLPDFGKMVGEVLADVADSGRAADTAAKAAVAGRGDIVDVVTAISETEMAMETLVSVRDKVISAYEEIMRMPI